MWGGILRAELLGKCRVGQKEDEDDEQVAGVEGEDVAETEEGDGAKDIDDENKEATGDGAEAENVGDTVKELANEDAEAQNLDIADEDTEIEEQPSLSRQSSKIGSARRTIRRTVIPSQ